MILDCKEVVANLSCYLDGEGAAELREALEEHLAKCHRCWVIADTTRKTLRIVTDVGPFEVPLEVSARLHDKLRALFAGR
jgi:anti-sigma factor (TIGR02949 family)